MPEARLKDAIACLAEARAARTTNICPTAAYKTDAGGSTGREVASIVRQEKLRDRRPDLRRTGS